MSTQLIRFMTRTDRPDDRKIYIAYTFHPDISNDMHLIAYAILDNFEWLFGVELDAIREWNFEESFPMFLGREFTETPTDIQINEMIEDFQERPYELLQRIEETNHPRTRKHPTVDAYTIAYNGNIKLDALRMLSVYDNTEDVTPEQSSIIYDCGHGYKNTQSYFYRETAQ